MNVYGFHNWDGGEVAIETVVTEISVYSRYLEDRHVQLVGRVDPAVVQAILRGAERTAADEGGLVIAWLVGTRVGRWIASVVAALTIIAWVLIRTHAAGRRAEAAGRTEGALEAQRTRIRIDDEVDEIGRDRRRDELSRWVRDDGR